MTVIGFIVAVYLFIHFKRHLEHHHRRERQRVKEEANTRQDCAVSWHEEWQRQWAGKFQKQVERRQRHFERQAQRHYRKMERHARKFGVPLPPLPSFGPTAEASPVEHAPRPEEEVVGRARRRARAEVGFYTHMMSYLGVIAFLALVNLLTTRYPWFLWPALGWGIGLFSHYMAVFGGRMMRERFWEPAVEREVRREKAVMNTEKQASIDELSSTIAHEIRNPIAAAKSLVQQMGEDPQSVENVEYAKVALDELDRVEKSISHLLKYAKEEDYNFGLINIANVVDAALTELKAKLDVAKVQVTRNYISGPTVLADREKMRQVFANILDNAIDALEPVPEGRRIELFVENGGRLATVRLRDNGAGIAADRIDRIFNPFFTTKEKGTGLGMAISKKIVEAHEGNIDVVSEQGKFTEFVVTLPLPS